MTSSTLHKTDTFRLPRIRTKDELLKTSPEIAELLGETIEKEDVFTIPAGRDATLQRRRPATSFHPRSSISNSLDSPRNFEDVNTYESSTFHELEEVKRERSLLMTTIAQFKTSSGSAGSEAQENDIKQLMKELEMKKHKLNELRQETKIKEIELAQSLNTSADCQKLMKSNKEYLCEYIQQLNMEMTAVKEDLVEVEAKNKLYALLGERTRQEHMMSEQKVRESREMRKACRDDVCSLSRAYHETCTLREEAEKKLCRVRKMNRQVQSDWQKKLKDRRKEVRGIRRRQLKEKEKESKKSKRKQEKERRELEQKDKRQKEEQAMEERMKALVPQIEALETTWNRLCSASGAESVEGIISYWQGLNSKGSSMQELVQTKETVEAAAKKKLVELYEKQATLLEKEDIKACATAPEGKHISQEENDDGSDPSFRNDKTKLMSAELQVASEAVGVRIEQGLTFLLQKLDAALGQSTSSSKKESFVPQAEGHKAEASQKNLLERLFKQLQNRVEELKKTKSSEENQEECSEKKQVRGSSFKRHKDKMKHSFSSDVSKLVGFVEDENQEQIEVSTDEDEDEVIDDGVVKRSFLKSRSQRFVLRGRKDK